MRNALVAFAVSVGILIIAVSTWVVLRARDEGGTLVAFTQAPATERSFFDVLTFSDPLAKEGDTTTNLSTPISVEETSAPAPEATTTPTVVDETPTLTTISTTTTTTTSTPFESIVASEPPFWQSWLDMISGWMGGVSGGTNIAVPEVTPTSTQPTAIIASTEITSVMPTPTTDVTSTATNSNLSFEQIAPINSQPAETTPPVETSTTDTSASLSFFDRFIPGGDEPSFAERMTSGQAALAVGDFRTAVTEFAAAAKADSSSVEALLHLSEAQFYDKSYEQALANLTAVEQLDATNPSIFILRGRIAIRTTRFQPAIEAFAKAGQPAAFWQGVMAAFYDRADEAQATFQKIVTEGGAQVAEAQIFLAAYVEYAKFPDSPKTHLDTLLARAFTQIGEFELASAKLTPVVASKPDYVSAWVLLGYAELHRENFDGARQALETAYRLNGADPKTQYLLGATYVQLKKYSQAERYLILARDNQYPDTRELSRSLGDLYYADGKFSEAAAAYAAMVAVGGGSVGDFVRPTYLYLEKVRDGRAAWSVAKLAIETHPEAAMSWNLAGWVSLANGYRNEAMGYLAKAIAIDPQLAAAYFNLGQTYEATNDTEQAKANYKKAYELDQTTDIGTRAGAAYNRLIGR